MRLLHSSTLNSINLQLAQSIYFTGNIYIYVTKPKNGIITKCEISLICSAPCWFTDRLKHFKLILKWIKKQIRIKTKYCVWICYCLTENAFLLFLTEFQFLLFFKSYFRLSVLCIWFLFDIRFRIMIVGCLCINDNDYSIYNLAVIVRVGESKYSCNKQPWHPFCSSYYLFGFGCCVQKHFAWCYRCHALILFSIQLKNKQFWV